MAPAQHGGSPVGAGNRGLEENTARLLQRFLDGERVPLRVDDVWVNRRQRLSALGYLQTVDSLLLLRRNKEPFAGYWTAPGGKLQAGESPRVALQREIQEETQLEVEEASLRLIASETGPQHYEWLLFGFSIYRWSGELGRTPEGELSWVARESLSEVAIPEVDRHVLPLVLEPERGQLYVARIRYGPGGSLENLQVEELAKG